ncbi:hypothetical protein DPMN_051806 [Dreissena polymorpha]|uniref:Uncharacterized protein n=1 Tax=Dreissena polymorpha TaxID=45954 RepID=A0A9D4HP83_DREPO|nr:hypothetical protein DPMN_051806 [Dreissena polymorpha]
MAMTSKLCMTQMAMTRKLQLNMLPTGNKRRAHAALLGATIEKLIRPTLWCFCFAFSQSRVRESDASLL